MKYISQVWPVEAARRVAGDMPAAAFAALWSERSCGLACVAMVVDCLLGRQPAFDELYLDAMALDGYCTAGWRHAALARLLTQRGIPSQVVPMNAERLQLSLADGHWLIVSVGNGFPKNPARRGGHLVVLHRRMVKGSFVHFAVKDPARFGRFRNTIRADRLLPSLGASAIDIPLCAVAL